MAVTAARWSDQRASSMQEIEDVVRERRIPRQSKVVRKKKRHVTPADRGYQRGLPDAPDALVHQSARAYNGAVARSTADKDQLARLLVDGDHLPRRDRITRHEVKARLPRRISWRVERRGKLPRPGKRLAQVVQRDGRQNPTRPAATRQATRPGLEPRVPNPYAPRDPR